MNKMRSRLRHWANRMLSMPSKMILMKYVLRAMPTFYLMLLDFTDAGYKELEAQEDCKSILIKKTKFF